MKKIIDAYTSLISRSARIFFGKSYYHESQPLGKHFAPNSIEGYYNDLTKKTNWLGETDNEGIPLNVLTNNKRIYFPITIAQMALGNYDLWLESKHARNKEVFLKLAYWLKDNQDESGGWINPWEYLRPSSLSNYSAMAQGEAISTLLRAHNLTNDPELIDSSYRAFYNMIEPMDRGGCSFQSDNGIYLEECPELPKSSVLNGWIFAVFGIYDLMLFTKDNEVKKIYENTINTLELSLSSYDLGYWSYYDLHGRIASPFYHSLHISLLEALYILTRIKSFKAYSEMWAQYRNDFFSRNRALGIKAIQKIRDPGIITIIK